MLSYCRNEVEPRLNKLLIYYVKLHLIVGFKVKVARISDFLKSIIKGLPLYIARKGSLMLVNRAAIIVDVKRLEAVTDDRNKAS